jgi:hypothetical protein
MDVNIPIFSLAQISLVNNGDYTPSYSFELPNTDAPCSGGVIYWKSPRGGWEVFGMSLADEKHTHNYKGRIAVGLFETTKYSGGGSPYVSPSYTSVDQNYSVNLKVLSRSVSELEGLSEISGSPAVYFKRTDTSRLELMRVASVSAPIQTMINGGDFSTVLKRISNQSQRVR